MAHQTITKHSNTSLGWLRIPRWLILIIGVQLILRIPNLFEPFSYGDEMIYLTLGEGIRQGLVLYKDIHDNKPPLLYFLASIAGNVFWFRVILAFWMSLTIVIFWKVVQKFFPKNERLQKASVIIFLLLSTLPLLEGNIANAEVFMIGLTLAGFYILLSKKKKWYQLIAAGLFFSLATLFKVPAAFDIPAIIIFWLITKNRNKDSYLNIIKRTILITIGFFVPIILSFAWYYMREALPEYVIAAFLQNFGYLSSWRPDDVQKSFFVRNGPLIFRGGIVLIVIGILLLIRKRLSKGFLFATILLALNLFAVTLSERPYPHYLIQAVPAFSILLGILIFSPRYEQVFSIVPILLVLLIPVYYKYYYYPTGSYYLRFFQFATKQINKDEYFNKFDGNVLRNYSISEYLLSSTKTTDKVFVWGDSSSIYALSRRLPPFKYVATYHINDFSNKEVVIKTLEEKLPEVIVILPNSDDLSIFRQLLQQKYILVGSIDGAQIWRAQR